MSFKSDTIAVYGVGLIGGSIALAAKQRGLTNRVIGIGRSAEKLAEAQRVGIIDSWALKLEDAAETVDFVVVCSPVQTIADSVCNCASACQPGTLITDAGSVKEVICEEISGRLDDDVAFIGSHPIAGSHLRGFQNANGDLFVDRVCVVTPADPAEAKSEPMSRLTDFWNGLGSSVIEMLPREHDKILAQTSHLPHLIAAVLSSTIEESQRELCGSGFWDSTRIAAGDSSIWAPILLQNRNNLLTSIDDFKRRLDEFESAVQSNQPDAIRDLLRTAQLARLKGRGSRDEGRGTRVAGQGSRGKGDGQRR